MVLPSLLAPLLALLAIHLRSALQHKSTWRNAHSRNSGIPHISCCRAMHGRAWMHSCQLFIAHEGGQRGLLERKAARDPGRHGARRHHQKVYYWQVGGGQREDSTTRGPSPVYDERHGCLGRSRPRQQVGRALPQGSRSDAREEQKIGTYTRGRAGRPAPSRRCAWGFRRRQGTRRPRGPCRHPLPSVDQRRKK